MIRFFPIGKLSKGYELGLLESAATRAHGLAGVSADGAGVGLGALILYGQVAGMARSSLRANVLKTLYVLRDFAAQLAFNEVLLGKRTDGLLLIRGEIGTLLSERNFCLLEDVLGTGRADAIDLRQRVNELLVVGNGDAGDTHGVRK